PPLSSSPSHGAHRHPHSFPTRRSSDLNRARLRPHLTPEYAAYLLHTQMLGLFIDWLAAPERWPLAEMAPTLVETAFFGLLADNRSEEHTSELQSRENLVCRLLLETKNT